MHRQHIERKRKKKLNYTYITKCKTYEVVLLAQQCDIISTSPQTDISLAVERGIAVSCYRVTRAEVTALALL